MPSEMTAWRPVLEGASREGALRSLREIATAVRSLLHNPEDVLAGGYSIGSWGLSDGLPGEALLSCYAASLFNELDSRRVAVEFADAAARTLAKIPLNPSLFDGIAGVAWTVQHVLARAAVQVPQDLFEEVDDALLQWVSNMPCHYDLIRGVVGVAVYGLERLPDPTARRILEAAAEYLDRTAVWTEAGVAWRAPVVNNSQRASVREDGFDLGVAHGTPAVIAVLAQLRSLQVATAVIDRILEPSVDFLLSVAVRDRDGRRFPSSVPSTPMAPQPRPRQGLAWCYGDLGVAATLALAGRAAGQDDWTKEAKAIAYEAARAAVPQTMCDPGLCHGSAGNALVFNRLFHATGEDVFLDATRRWYEKLLASRRAGFAGGYPVLESQGGNEDKRWAVRPGFIVGLAGVGLSLCAACTDVAPDWDRVLLLSSALCTGGAKQHR